MNSILLVLLNILALVIIIGWLNTSWRQFKSVQFSIHSFWRLLKMPLLLFLLVGGSYLTVQTGITKPDLNSFEAKRNYYEDKKDYKQLSELFREALLKEDSFRSNPEFHFEMINNYRLSYLNALNSNTGSFDLKEDDLNNDIEAFYQEQAIRRPYKEVFLAMHYVNTGRLLSAKKLLDQVEDPEFKYYNYTLGRYYKRAEKIDSAVYFFEWEIKFDGYREGTKKELSALYYSLGLFLPLKELVYEDEHNDIHFYFKRIVFFIEKDIPNYFGSIFKYELSKVNPIGTSAAFLIAFIWLFYVRKLDIFEPERWRYVLLAFALGALFVELVYPLTDFLNVLGEFSLNGDPWNDFLYCFIGIGMIEELVKAIPLLIIVLLTKQADEPYDFILYAAASALGFAFVENISYIEASELKNINARMLTAAVAHMSFSSTIAYGVLLGKFVYKKHRFLIVASMFVLASLAHGFYDFWLINEWAIQYSGLTIVFFIGTVHLWFIMKNNAINISNYFDSKIKINNDDLKNYLILSLVFVLMFSYLAISGTQGKEAANSFFFSQVLSYMYFILYLTYSFSRFDVVRGYLAPFSIPFDFMVPRLKETPNYSGTRLALGLFELNPAQNKHPHHILIRGVISQRKTVSGNKHWYLLVSEFPIVWEGISYRYFLVKHHDRNVELNSGRRSLVQVMGAEDEAIINETFLKKEDLNWISWGVAKALTS